MRIAALGDQRHDAGHAEFCALLDGPLHTIELEDGEGQGDFKRSGRSNFVSQVKFNPMIVDGRDASAANGASGGDIELLADLCAEDSNQVIGMSAGERRAVGGRFVGNPAAACHGSLIVNAMLGKKIPHGSTEGKLTG